MDEIILFLFALWAIAMIIGIIITLLPVILFFVGMFVTIGFFALVGMAFAHAFH